MASYAASQDRGYPWTRHNELAARNYAAVADSGALVVYQPKTFGARSVMSSYAARRYRHDTMRMARRNFSYMRRTGQSWRAPRRSGETRTVGNYRRFTGSGSGNAPREKKFQDLRVPIETTKIDGTITRLDKIVQGADATQRIGRKCCIFNVNFKLQLVMLTLTDPTTTEDNVRFGVVIDHQTNGATPILSEIIEAGKFDGYRVLNNQERFTMLLDKTVNMRSMISGNGTTTRTGAATRFIQKALKTNIIMEYAGGVGTVGEIKSNGVFFFIVSAEATAEWELSTRIRFGDCLM